MIPAENWLSYVGIYLCSPNSNGIGNSWELEITNGIASVDEAQTNFIPFIDETEQTKITTPKFTPKYVPPIRKENQDDATD